MATRRAGAFARKRLDKHLKTGGLTTAEIERAIRRKGGIGTRLATAVLVRLATRSVPGALVVGGGLVAKALIERRRRRSEP